MKLETLTYNVRRFFVRPDGFGGKGQFRVAAMTVINFGEKSAGNIATCIKNKTAKENEEINPEVSKMSCSRRELP